MSIKYKYKVEFGGVTIVRGSVVLDSGSVTISGGNITPTPASTWHHTPGGAIIGANGSFAQADPAPTVFGTMCLTYTPTQAFQAAHSSGAGNLHSVLGMYQGSHPVKVATYYNGSGSLPYITHVDTSLSHTLALNPIGLHAIKLSDGSVTSVGLAGFTVTYTADEVWNDYLCCVNPCPVCDKATVVFDTCCVEWSRDLHCAVRCAHIKGINFSWCNQGCGEDGICTSSSTHVKMTDKLFACAMCDSDVRAALTNSTCTGLTSDHTLCSTTNCTPTCADCPAN